MALRPVLSMSSNPVYFHAINCTVARVCVPSHVQRFHRSWSVAKVPLLAIDILPKCGICDILLSSFVVKVYSSIIHVCATIICGLYMLCCLVYIVATCIVVVMFSY